MTTRTPVISTPLRCKRPTRRFKRYSSKNRYMVSLHLRKCNNASQLLSRQESRLRVSFHLRKCNNASQLLSHQESRHRVSLHLGSNKASFYSKLQSCSSLPTLATRMRRMGEPSYIHALLVHLLFFCLHMLCFAQKCLSSLAYFAWGRAIIHGIINTEKK